MIKVCVNCSQSVAMSWFAVMNCNKKHKIIGKCPISGYLKRAVIIKTGLMLQAAKLIIYHPESSYVKSIFKKRASDPSWKLENELYYKAPQISRFSPRSMPTFLPHKKDNKYNKIVMNEKNRMKKFSSVSF